MPFRAFGSLQAAQRSLQANPRSTPENASVLALSRGVGPVGLAVPFRALGHCKQTQGSLQANPRSTLENAGVPALSRGVGPLGLMVAFRAFAPLQAESQVSLQASPALLWRALEYPSCRAESVLSD